MTTAETPRFEVHNAARLDQKQEIYRFRYRIYCEEIGRDVPSADHHRKLLKDRLDADGVQLCMTLKGEMVAVLRINMGTQGGVFPNELAESYGIEKFVKSWRAERMSMTSRFLVSDKWRHTNAAAILLGAGFKILRQNGSRFDFTHVPPYLVNLFEQLGYRRYSDNFIDEDDSYRVPLVLLTEDIDHLQRVKSPFARIAATFESPKDTMLWFMREFDHFAGRQAAMVGNEEKFWQYLTDKLHQTPLLGIPMLNGLTYSEAKQFLNLGTVIPCRGGDPVIRAGEIGNEMYVVLSGSCEVRAAKDKGGHVLKKLATGEVFGELALLAATPRSADVVACEPMELLVINQAFFQKVMKSMPEVATQVLFNMCLILIGRLQTTSQNLIDTLQKTQAAPAAESDDSLELSTRVGR